MSKFDDIISSYCGGLLNEEDPAAMPAQDPAAVPAAPVQPDATMPQPGADDAPMTPEGRIQMLDMVRKALLISPTDLKDAEKMELGTTATHGNVEAKKTMIAKIFSRLDATGTTDLGGEEPGEEF